MALSLTACQTSAPVEGPLGNSNACAGAIAYSDEHKGLSVLAIRNGTVFCSSGETSIHTPNELWSGTKSFVGVMAAAAVQDHLLTLDEKAADTLTEWQDDPTMSQITLRQILSMTDGQASQVGQPPSYRNAIAVPATTIPGTKFQYGPTPMQVFGEIMKRKLDASGQPNDPLIYLDKRILTPLGIRSYQWRKGEDGNPLMPQGAILSASDWAKFGNFILHEGEIEDTAIVDQTTFQQLFNGSEANPAYGLTWWLAKPTEVSDPITATTDILGDDDAIPGDLVFAAGAGDQRLYVIPSKDLVIVRQAKLDLKFLATNGWKSGWSDAAFLKLVLNAEARAKIDP
jgi:CubicO group peptidase (beta-lactamase class C family)